MVGVPGLTATARELALAINRVDGLTVGADADAQVIDFAAAPLAVYLERRMDARWLTLAGFALFGIEWLWGWPDWLTVNGKP